MARVKVHATESESADVRRQIVELKTQIKCTYSQLAKLLERPCTPGTLQQRVRYPKKPMSKKLYNKIANAIVNYQNQEKNEIEDKLLDAIDNAIATINKTAQEEILRLKNIVNEIKTG